MAKLTNELSIDVSRFLKGIDRAANSLNKLEGVADPKVSVLVDASDVDAAEAKIAGLSGTETVKVNVDTKGAEAAAGGFASKLGAFGAVAGGALGGAASQAIAGIGSKLVEGATAADDFGDKLEVAFTQQGIQDVDAEIEKVNKTTLELANNLGLPVARTRELAGSVATLGGFTGKSAEDLTKLSAGLEVFTDGAVRGEQVAKAFSRGIADPEGAAAIDILAKKYPQLAEVLKSNLSPTEKLQKANEFLAESYKTVEEQQNDAGGILNKLQNQLGEVFEKVGSQLLDAVAPIAQALLPIIESLLPVLESVLEPLTPILEQVGGAIVQIVDALAGPLATLLTAVLGPVLDLVLLLLPPIQAIIQTALQPLAAVINIVAEAVSALLPPIVQALTPALDTITKLFNDLAPVLTALVSTALTPILDVIKILAPVIGQLLSTSIKLLLAVVQPLLPAFFQLVPVIAEFAKVIALILPPVANLVALLGDLLVRLVDNRVVMGVIQGAVTAVSKAMQVLAGILGGLASAAQAVAKFFGELVTRVRDVLEAIASFDLTKIKNALLGFGKEATKVKTATTATTAAIATTSKTAADAADNTNKLGDNLNKTGGAASKASDNIAKLRGDISKLATEQAKLTELEQANTIADATERQIAILAIERKYARLGLKEQLAAVKGNSKEAVLQRELLNAQLAAIDRDFASREADVRNALAVQTFEQQAELAKRAAETAKAINADLIEELRRQVEVGNVSAIAGLAKATRVGIEAELEASVDAIVESTPEFTRGAEEIKRQLSEGLIDVDTARKQTELLGQTILNELLAVPGGAGNAFADQIRALYDKAAASVKASEAEIIDAAEQRRIAAIGSDIVRGIEERVRALQAERDQLLENTELTAKQREEIERGFGQAIDEVRRGPIRDLGNTLAGIFEAASSFTFTFDTEDAQAAADDLKAKTEEINESLRAGEISYQEAIDKLAELEQQAVDSTSAVAQALQQALQQTADAAREQVTQSLTAYNDLRAEATRIGKDTTKTEEQRAAELNVITGQLADQQTELYGQIGIAAGAAFATAVASGENAFKSLVLVALDSLQALIPILTAQIFGINVASPNPANVASFGAAGIAAAAATTAILQGLVAVARAAVAGFKHGGYTGNGGINDVAGVVHGREFVVNARATAKYRDVLEAMNNGRPLDLIAKDKRSGMYVDINGGLNTVATIMADVRDRLDRIPDQAFMKQQVGVDVALDDRLYERQRYRKQVRGLR